MFVFRLNLASDPQPLSNLIQLSQRNHLISPGHVPVAEVLISSLPDTIHMMAEDYNAMWGDALFQLSLSYHATTGCCT